MKPIKKLMSDTLYSASGANSLLLFASTNTDLCNFPTHSSIPSSIFHSSGFASSVLIWHLTT